jgi:hypothetical protein
VRLGLFGSCDFDKEMQLPISSELSGVDSASALPSQCLTHVVTPEVRGFWLENSSTYIPRHSQSLFHTVSSEQLLEKKKSIHVDLRSSKMTS